MEGKPEVFIIAGCGTGIPVYRRLQKMNIPFATGILYTNDVDYRLARLLAVEMVTEEPFREISVEAMADARALIAACGRVIMTGVPIGETNRRLEELAEDARQAGKLEFV